MSSDDSSADNSSLFYDTDGGSGSDEGDAFVDDGDEEYEEGTAVMSSESLPIFKDLMRRVISVNKNIKSILKTVDEYQTTQAPGTRGREEFENNGQKLLELTTIFCFLFSRLLRILEDEHRQCAEVYANTLNLEDRVPFESLTHAVHHNTFFCDILGELIDVAFEKKPAANEDMPPERRALLLAHYRQLGKTQATATYFGVLVVEGTRESFLDPVEMVDLCSVVVNDTTRRKRLIPLSLMFSMLDQDDQAVADALAANLPRVLMQRLRHLTHKLFSSKEPDQRRQVSRRGSPSRSPHRASRRTSPAPTSARHEHMHQRSPQRSPPSSTTRGQRSDVSPVEPPLGALEAVPMAEEEGTLLASSLLPGHLASASSNHEPESTEAYEPPPKFRRLDAASITHCLQQQGSHLRIGDRVGRGPGWRTENQGVKCDSGVVVGFTKDDRALVRWILSADATGTRGEDDHDRFFIYTYRQPPFEIVSWDTYLEIMTRTVDTEELKLVEFMQICAVAGFLCKQKDAILPTLQFQTIECLLDVVDSLDLENARTAAEEALKESEDRTRVQLGLIDEESERERLLPILLRWDDRLRTRRQRYHDSRDLVDRVGWVLNALLSHKKIAMLFLELGGLDRVMKLSAGNADTDTVYGVCVVLTHLSKTAIFEVVLRNHQQHFLPMLHFVMEQWQYNRNPDVQASAGSFLFHALSFPCVLAIFEQAGGHLYAVDALEKNLRSSEEVFDVISASAQLAILKCINVYLICQLMLSTKVIFRKHRTLSVLVTRATAHNALPHDAATVDAVLYYLSSTNPSLPDITVENVQSLLTPERLSSIQCVIDKGLHSTLLRCTNFYFVQGRWDVLISALQALCVLTVVPYLRPLIAETHAHDSGISQLLLIIGDLATSSRNKNTSREHHLLPCATTALQILINILMPPADTADEGVVATFNSTCGAFRGSDGIRTLLDVLQLKKDAPLSAKLYHFPVIARAVQLMVILRRFGDTAVLFEALNVHRCASDLHAQYGDVQREYIAMMGPRKLHTELDPAGRFMENVKSLMPGACGDAASSEVVRAVADDPLELEQRQAIISRAVIDYSKPSLLELMARHLESEGLPHAARVLRDEAELDVSTPAPVTSSELKSTSHSLDEVVQAYLRQQQERCPNPIETLPQFDLTQKHVYLPPSAPLDDTRNAFNLQLYKKTNALHCSLRQQVNTNSFTHRYLSHVFDVAGNEGLRGECIAFCDGGEALIIGTAEGEIGVFDTFPDDTYDERLLEHHVVLENEGITSIQVSRNNTLLALMSEGNVARVMRRDSLPIVRVEVPCSDLRFSHDSQWGLATVDDQHTCALWDLSTKVEVRRFSDTVWSGENIDNVAVFDYSSQLILNDAVLWDLRTNDKPIFRFDRITESFTSVFHPSNSLVILDQNVWDLRTMRIVQTIPAFQKTSGFHVNPHGSIIYSFREAGGLRNTSVPIVSAVDSYSFEVIFSEETRPPFRCFALDPSDRYCAAILDEDAMDTSVIRCFNTSAGPFLGRPNFAVADAQEGALGEDEDELEIDDEDEDGDGDWLSGDSVSMDSMFGEVMDDDDDDDDYDDEGEETSASSELEDDEGDDEEDDDLEEAGEDQLSDESQR